MEYSDAKVKIEPDLIIDDQSEIEGTYCHRTVSTDAERLDSDCTLTEICNDVPIVAPPLAVTNDVKRTTKCYDCQICAKSFTNRKALNKHIIYHASGRAFACDFCSRVSRTQYSLHVHIQNCHNEQIMDSGHTCKICNKRFLNNSNLGNHMKSHAAKVRNFRCDICQGGFTNYVNLCAHMNLHTHEKQYKCDVCAKVFLSASYFKKHENFHTEKRKYPCDKCDRVYFYNSHLKRHLNTHTRAKTYTCEPCGKTFMRTCSLRVHMHVHQNKSYACAECGLSWKRMRSYHDHLKLNHKWNDELKCKICGRQFWLRERYESHMGAHTKRLASVNTSV